MKTPPPKPLMPAHRPGLPSRSSCLCGFYFVVGLLWFRLGRFCLGGFLGRRKSWLQCWLLANKGPREGFHACRASGLLVLGFTGRLVGRYQLGCKNPKQVFVLMTTDLYMLHSISHPFLQMCDTYNICIFNGSIVLLVLVQLSQRLHPGRVHVFLQTAYFLNSLMAMKLFCMGFAIIIIPSLTIMYTQNFTPNP